MSWEDSTPEEKLLVLEPEDWTAEEWQAYCKLFGCPVDSDVINVEVDIIKSFKDKKKSKKKK